MLYCKKQQAVDFNRSAACMQYQAGCCAVHAGFAPRVWRSARVFLLAGEFGAVGPRRRGAAPVRGHSMHPALWIIPTLQHSCTCHIGLKIGQDRPCRQYACACALCCTGRYEESLEIRRKLGGEQHLAAAAAASVCCFCVLLRMLSLLMMMLMMMMVMVMVIGRLLWFSSPLQYNTSTVHSSAVPWIPPEAQPCRPLLSATPPGLDLLSNDR